MLTTKYIRGDILRLKNHLMNPGVGFACNQCFKYREFRIIKYVYDEHLIIECKVCGYKEKHEVGD